MGNCFCKEKRIVGYSVKGSESESLAGAGEIPIYDSDDNQYDKIVLSFKKKVIYVK